jgi:diguanylate cyclase (GGDEF)-like protein
MKERRKEPRSRSLRGGKILFNNKQSVISCTIRNISAEGANLQVQSTFGIPAFFDLLIEGETAARPCDLIWKANNRLGVEFCQSALKPQKVAEVTAHDHLPATPASHTGTLRGDLLALRAALDEVDFGVVLLDAGLRAQFINKAYVRLWRLPTEKAESKPAFVTLMYHGRDTHAYDIPDDQLNEYIENRVAHVRAGNPTPIDLRLTNGEIIRFQCMKLPAGGRMLSYTHVTDIARHSDELKTRRAALDNIDRGVILLDGELRAQYLNRAVRKLWKINDQQADSKPPYAQLVSDLRRTGMRGIAGEALETHIARRISLVRAGDSRPMDIRHRDGRIIRSQCAVLPNGGRMLTYTDVTDLVRRGEELERPTTIDNMTGVYNRQHFLTLADSEWLRFKRYQRPLSLLIFDIDHFKNINDRYGHDAGDRAIAHVIDLCKACNRSSDSIGRIGGDEFAMLLPETNLAQASIVAERLRQVVAESIFREYGKPVTLSIGLAQADRYLSSIGELVKNADRALYQAKSFGRNCVMPASGQDTDTCSDDGDPARRTSSRRCM